jgi:hypothetical protein
MDIKWYKNGWYGLTLAVSFAIFLLAFISTKSYTLGLYIENGQKTELFLIETFFRAVFNPLWAIALWTYNKGQQLNSKRHKDILLNIQGALDSHDDEEMKVSKIYAIVYEYDDIEKRLKKKLSKTDTVEDQPGAPTI